MTFQAMSDLKMATLIERATSRVLVAVPAIRMATAAALVAAVERLGRENVAIVMDCEEDVFRLGYGEIEALRTLQNYNCSVRQSPGLRIGLLVCDDRAWTFSPTALYVQAEVQSDETPNAILLLGDDVQRLVSRIVPMTHIEIETADEPDVVRQNLASTEIEIGLDEVRTEQIDCTSAALEQAPPIAFDVARQVRVFEPYIQYVDIKLRGCAIQRHRVEVPPSIQGLDPGSEFNSRLRTTFELIERTSAVSSQSLEKELKELRKNFTRPLGEPWGRVVLRSVRPLLDDRIEKFRERLEGHKVSVKEELALHLDKSRAELVAHYAPLVERSRPEFLLGQIPNRPPTADQINRWLDAEIGRVIPKPDELLKDMSLEVQFRDVTYETLNESGFGEKLREAYPHVNWDKPFNEFDAAKERDAQESEFV